MADNIGLGAAKTAKNDEFYTLYSDIEAEINAYVVYNPDVFRGNHSRFLVLSKSEQSFHRCAVCRPDRSRRRKVWYR